MSDVHAYEVSVKNTNWTTIVNHVSAGKAKAEYYSMLADCWPDIPFTDLRCRKVGYPVTSDEFKRNARYRGMPDVRCGQKVKVGKSEGVIVGHNSSANFNVLFTSGPYLGQTLNVHPSEVELNQEAA